ncbi:hypothetical protein NBRC116592_03850 [Colwellia sp. KU-HH00111]|uniref:hypothetical protein n=1 Tax=Colwellia sp. KU-HH00111 TaxID=3127652 RepID=UPI0031031734
MNEKHNALSGLNHLTLKPAGHYRGLGMIFNVYIDGVCFLDNIADFEKRFHDRINGAYTAALGCEDIMHSMIVTQNETKRFMPYACDCGEWSCWVFQGFVTSYDDFVFWGQWRNSHRSDKDKKADGLYWNYKDFPTLCFDKHQYLSEIDKAQALVNADKPSLNILAMYNEHNEQKRE